MKELVYIAPSRLEWHDRPDPRLEASTDAIVRPFVSARCDGDPFFLTGPASKLLGIASALHLVDPAFGSAETNIFHGPFAYGHECVAEVLEVGADVRSVQRGSVVIVPWALSCGKCAPCAAGLTSHCATTGQDVAAYGFGGPIGGHGGMVSDLLRVPHADHMLHVVPPGIEPVALASASDNIVDAYRTVAPHLERMPGAPVLVIAGAAKSIGLYAAGIAVALGAERVDYLDASRDRLEIAESLGANPVERGRGSSWFDKAAPLRREGYPVVVEASSSTPGLAYAIRSLARGGVCTAIGFYLRRGTPVPLWQMYMRSATLHVGIGHPSRDLAPPLALVASRRFQPEKVKPLVAPWNDAPKALLEPATKLVLTRERVTA